jgi:hypothetical protein
MPKVIRVKNSTFDLLTNKGKWTDTMDDIIRRLLDNDPVNSDRKNNDDTKRRYDN